MSARDLVSQYGLWCVVILASFLCCVVVVNELGNLGIYIFERKCAIDGGQRHEVFELMKFGICPCPVIVTDIAFNPVRILSDQQIFGQ
jgi:hypothetical protein